MTVNCGSSTLKLAICDVTDGRLTPVLRASADGIGGGTPTIVVERGGRPLRRPVDGAGQAAALEAIARELRDGLTPDAVGHRVVQGGRISDSTRIDEGVLQEIERVATIAPLHNGPALEGIRAAAALFPVPAVAVFDTQFHASLPEVAWRYALPVDLADELGLRRIGYHGIAHRSMSERYAELAGRAMADVNLITLHLGGGCSATAVRGGRSVDTSMGFTPLEGLVMRTRAGDIDAGVVTYLARETGMTADQLDELLNRRSGLAGMSGISGDVRALLREEAAGNARAAIALDVFCYRARKYIGSYMAALGHVDALVFGGGIGENEPEIRSRIVEPLRPLGLELDAAANEAGGEGRISGPGSPVQVFVINVDEERVIATETVRVLTSERPGGS